MKLLQGVIFTKVGEQTIVVAAGDATKKFNGMIKLNSSATFIAELMKNEFELANVIVAVQKEYGIDQKTAKQAVVSVLEQFKKVGLIEE